MNNPTDVSRVLAMRHISPKIWCTAIAIALTGLGLFCLLGSSAYARVVNELNCATNEFAPYGYKEDGKLQGIEVEVFHEIGRRLNIETNLKLLPWKRVLGEMEEGEIDCMFAAFKTEKRAQFMDYTTVPIHVSSLVFYHHKNKPFQFKDLNDLKGLTISLVRGFKTTPEFDKAAANKLFTIEPANSIEQSFRKLNRQRVDLTLYNAIVARHIVKKLNLKDVVAAPNPLKANSAYITFSKKRNHADLVSKFDAVLFDILTDGTYQRLFNKYVGSQ